LATTGDIDMTPFKPPVQAGVGETIFSFLERIARDREVLIGSTSEGEWLLIGKNSPQTGSVVIEGENIKSAQFVINDIEARNYFRAIGQSAADDSHHGKSASEMVGTEAGNLGIFSPLVVPMEHPVWTQHEVDLRASFENKTKTGTEITATVTVYGWFNSIGRLWKPLDMCTVTSPMAALPTSLLAIESVIFEQDRQGGTRTTLELKSPWALLKYGFQMSDTDPRNKGNPVPGPGSPIPLTF
jgi:prophage tail gpP-like protein